MKLFLRLLALVLGLACLGLFLRSADFEALGAALAELGWRAPLAFLPWTLVTLCDTAGWFYAFRGAPGGGVRPLTILRLRLAGETVNNIVPSGHLGGEAVKVYLLGKRGLSAADGAASIVVSKTLQSLAQILVLAIAAAAALPSLAADSPLRLAMLGVIAAGLLMLGLAAWLQRGGFFTGVLTLLRFVGQEHRVSAERAAGLRAFDDQIRGFYRDQRRAALLSLGFYTAGWVLGALEIMTAAWLLGAEIGFGQALAVEAFVGVFKALAFFIPGAVGVQESGIIVLCRALGLAEELGLSYALLRRARELLYVFIGGAFLLGEESLNGLRARVSRVMRRPESDADPGGEASPGGSSAPLTDSTADRGR